MGDSLLLLWAFIAGVSATLLGAIVTGFLVYKTKYAGEKILSPRIPTAEAFNVDGEYLEEDIEPVDYPEEIEDGNENFLKQFNMQQLIREAEAQEPLEE